MTDRRALLVPGLVALGTLALAHNSFAGWSLGRGNADTYLCVGISEENLRVLFERVEQVNTVVSPWRSHPLWLAQGARASFDSVWDQLRVYQ